MKHSYQSRIDHHTRTQRELAAIVMDDPNKYTEIHVRWAQAVLKAAPGAIARIEERKKPVRRDDGPDLF